MIGNGTNNLSFLYTDRLVELARGDSAPAVTLPTTSDVFDPNQDLLSLMPPERHDAQTLLTSAVTNANTQNGLKNELLNYILTRAGYTPKDVKELRAEYESIIMTKGNIFEKMFLQIKNQLAVIHAREALISPAKRMSADAMAREARDKALAELANDYFNSLAAHKVYHAEDSKYYFAENDLAKSLSNDFLTRLYQNPDLANMMLSAQKEKTFGQAQAKKEELVKLLPSIHYSESSVANKKDEDTYLHDLSLVEQDFDLYLASPSIIDIANGSFDPFAPKSTPRAAIIRRMQAGIEDLSVKMEKLQIKNANQSARDALIGKLSLTEGYLLDLLITNGCDLPDESHLNTVETVFITCQKVREFALRVKNKRDKMKPKLEEEIKELSKDIRKIKERLEADYKVKNKLVPVKKDDYPELSEKQLKELNASQTRIYFEKLSDVYAKDAELKILQSKRDSVEKELAGFDILLKEIETNLSEYKDAFIKAYYPEVIPAAKALTQSYQGYIDEQAKINEFIHKGGTYSCLSFIPVKIAGKNGSPDKFECLVAMSGAEINSADAINAHKLLEEFARTSPSFNGFTFRYVDTSPSVDLVLRQLGKGLSGTEKPIAPYTRVDQCADDLSLVMPDYEKACAEKRLVSELIKLYRTYGDDIQVLGCDNIALPKASDLTSERQKVLNPSAEEIKASEAAKAKAKKPAAVKVSPMFKLAATVREINTNKHVVLEGEHITCCSSCQAQKPAVFTALYDAKQQHFARLRAAETASFEQADQRKAIAVGIK